MQYQWQTKQFTSFLLTFTCESDSIVISNEKDYTMIEQYEFAKQLRNLLRRADTFGYDLQRLKEEVLFVAEIQEENAERIEMQMIIQAQQDIVEAA